MPKTDDGSSRTGGFISWVIFIYWLFFDPGKQSPNAEDERRWLAELCKKDDAQQYLSQYISFRLEMLKPLAAANGTAFLGVGAFLTSTSIKVAWVIVLAKACLCIFTLAILMTGRAFWYFNSWVFCIDPAIFLQKKGDEITNNRAVQMAIDSATRSSWSLAVAVGRATALLILGGILATFGLLLYSPR